MTTSSIRSLLTRAYLRCLLTSRSTLVLDTETTDLDDLATRLLLDHGPMPGARLK